MQNHVGQKHRASEAPCERCGRPQVQISLTIGERPVVMRSCSRCDRRSWSSEGENLALPGVLDRIGATRR
jgi:ribosomal protein L37E